MTEPEDCHLDYCVGGPCAFSCLRMDDSRPIEMPADYIRSVAARIRAARESMSDDQTPNIPLRRAADIYNGLSAPTARELMLYAEACNVSADWLLTGVSDAQHPLVVPQVDSSGRSETWREAAHHAAEVRIRAAVRELRYDVGLRVLAVLNGETT